MSVTLYGVLRNDNHIKGYPKSVVYRILGIIDSEFLIPLVYKPPRVL